MSINSVFGSKCYTYSSEDKLPSQRHPVFYDETGEYVLKFFPSRDDEIVAKIDHLIRFRENFLGKNPKYSYLVSAFPIERVYSSEEKQPSEWLGFVMKRCRDKSLDTVGIRTKGFKEYFNADSYVLLLTVCASLCLCCQTLHRNKFLLSDIKPDNFFVTRQGQVYPIDTDGFSYDGGPSQPPKPSYCPGKADYDNVRSYCQNVETESYALTILLFQMLTIDLSGNVTLDTIRSYDLLGVGEYAEALKGGMLKGRRQLFYQKWFHMPQEFRDIFINAIYNRCYLLPTATGWYGLIKKHINTLNEQGADMKIVPDQLPPCWFGLDTAQYFKEADSIQSIRVTSENIHKQTRILEEQLARANGELTKVRDELANTRERSAQKNKEQQKELDEQKELCKQQKKTNTLQRIFITVLAIMLLCASVCLLYQNGLLDSFLVWLQHT